MTAGNLSLGLAGQTGTSGMSERCRLCGHETTFQFKKMLLHKFNASYFECTHCRSLQTEDPYWLNEAYGAQAERFDTGKAARTLDNFLSLPSLFDILGIQKNASCVDWGGGSGLLARLLRDVGYDFYNYDKYSTSEFAQGFLWESGGAPVSVVTAFEVVEHFSNPIADFDEIFKLSPDLLICSTRLYEGQGDQWDYLSPENGQHVFFYSEMGLAHISNRHGYSAYKVAGYLVFFKTPLGISTTALISNWPTQRAEAQRRVYEAWALQPYRFATQDNDMLKRQVRPSTDRPIVIDMVFFQINQSGIARVWETLLRSWAHTPFGRRLIILDRAKTAPRIDGLAYRDIRAYDYSATDADGTMLQEVCDQCDAGLFISTYYSMPHKTPSLMMVYDMIPEVLGWDLSPPMWREKAAAIASATRFICISARTASDLNLHYSSPPESVVVAHCGVDARFHEASAVEVRDFKQKYGVSQPYFLIAGERGAHKNVGLFFAAMARLPNRDQYQILCLGGRPVLEPEFAAWVPDVSVTMLRVSDEEMRCAYSGALALVYPSRYEGFGMPVIEAMACACPVITCRGGSIPEVAGNDVLYVGFDAVDEMTKSLELVQDSAVRARLVRTGLIRSKRYSWEKMAAIVQSAVEDCPVFSRDEPTRDSADEQLLATVNEAVQLVAANRYDTAVLSKITAARLMCAKALFEGNEGMFSHRLQGTLGQAHRVLIESGVAQLLPIKTDVPFMDRINESLRTPKSPSHALEALAAAMLYAGPHLLQPRQAIPGVQGGLQERYRQYLFTPPASFRDVGEADRYAQYFVGVMEELVAGIESSRDVPYWDAVALDFVNTSSMIPLYFADSPLQHAMGLRAKLIEHLISKQVSCPGLDFEFPTRPLRRIRLGILAAHFRPQTETYATLPVYSHLDRDQFEVVLISQVAFGDHPLERHCLSFAEQSVSLTGSMATDVNAIRDLDLDVLWIGTNLTAVMNYMVQLAVHRMARLQMTGGCSPATTGFKNMDVFVSGEATEPLDAAAHYTERLCLVDGPAHCFDMAESLVTSDISESITRSSLGIADDVTLFVSGANFFKIIPELLDAWLEILQKSENSRILLFPFNPNWTSKYPVANFLLEISRRANALGVSSDRFIIVPPLPDRSAVLGLIQMADVYLDSFPYSGMTSLLDPLEMGVPVIAIEGTCQRQRMSASALRSLRLDDWLVDSRGAYVARAVELASSPARRHAMRELLSAAMRNNPKFLDAQWFSKAVGQILKSELTRVVNPL